jgi:drug/metabolite transporter (DMT)-like permease
VSGFAGGLAARRAGALQVAAGAQLAGFALILVVLVAVRPPWPGLVDLLPALFGGLAGGLGLAALFRAFSAGQMSLTAPIAATGVAVPIVASFVLGEVPTALQGAGVVLAVGGVVIATYEAGSGRSGIAYALVAALLFGLFYLGLDQSGEADVLWAVVAARALSVLVLVSAAWQRGARPRGVERGRTVLSGSLDVAANAAFTWATTVGALVLAAVPAALYPVVTLLCARLFLHERLGSTQRLGALLALAGVACMAVPQ